MSEVLRRGATAFALAVFSLSTHAAIAAPTLDECVDANTQAQTLRRSGELKKARDRLKLCGTASCPSIVRDDCTKRLDEIAQAMPAIVFEVKDGSGKDLSAVRITADAQPLVDTIDGTPIEMDPGEHAFTLEVAGEAPVTLKVVLREGDRARRERVVIGAPPPEAAVGTGDPSAPPTRNGRPPETVAPASNRRILGLGLAIGGLAGIGVGTAFGLRASSQWSSAQNGCSSPSTCPNHAASISDRDGATTSATVSTIAFIAGGAAVAAGAILYLTAPKSGAKRTGVGVSPLVIGSGGGLSIQGVM